MTKEEIKQTYTMADIVARYGLEPNRGGFIPCPFHQGDRHPSMKIYEKDYNCYACGENGDIFTFVMRMEGLSFPEAFLKLGGAYQKSSMYQKRKKEAQRKQALAFQRGEEGRFQLWRQEQLNRLCRMLQMMDRLEKSYKPLSDEWIGLQIFKQRYEYHYSILAFGTKKEQEAMREADG